jgi:hypothetical protein
VNKPLEILLYTLHLGAYARIVALEISGKCEPLPFIRKLKQSNPIAYDSLFARFKAVAEREHYSNTLTFRSLGGGLYEFKTKSTGIRLYAFYDQLEGHTPQLIIATNGGAKNTKKQQSRDIKKARGLMERYLEAKKSPGLTITIKQ